MDGVCVFVAGIHPSRTWMSGSLKSVRCNACVHRLDLGLYSHPKELWGNGVRTHVNSKGKNGGSQEVWTCHAASHRTASPTRYQLSYSGPGWSTNAPMPSPHLPLPISPSPTPNLPIVLKSCETKVTDQLCMQMFPSCFLLSLFLA